MIFLSLAFFVKFFLTFLIANNKNNNNNKIDFKSGMISFISTAPAMTSEVIIITKQYCNYKPLYSLAPSKIITSKRRDQPSTYLYVALFILGENSLIYSHNDSKHS
jgi:hypothetical protein